MNIVKTIKFAAECNVKKTDNASTATYKINRANENDCSGSHYNSNDGDCYGNHNGDCNGNYSGNHSKAYADKLFSVVYADPPWDIANQHGNKGAHKHYELMTLDRIKKMPISTITAENSVCFLWLSNGIYQEGLDVLKAWGYRPTSDFIWIKPRIGLGQYFRYASEKMLMGVRGKMPPAIRSQPNWGFFPLQEHSHKPEEIYTIIERMYPNGHYLELFARRRPPNNDWYIWGNEAPGGSDVYFPDYPVPSYSERANRLKEGDT